ncbi:serine/arginine repetitive matrix protein 1-like [Penaeus indicus]|uniref:serine/arginine repetitive matrix protein 1-like n=1 Tax=Penaeus indicus TaxID=29960 RepID=UPI00300C4CD9
MPQKGTRKLPTRRGVRDHSSQPSSLATSPEGILLPLVVGGSQPDLRMASAAMAADVTMHEETLQQMKQGHEQMGQRMQELERRYAEVERRMEEQNQQIAEERRQTAERHQQLLETIGRVLSSNISSNSQAVNDNEQPTAPPRTLTPTPQQAQTQADTHNGMMLAECPTSPCRNSQRVTSPSPRRNLQRVTSPSPHRSSRRVTSPSPRRNSQRVTSPSPHRISQQVTSPSPRPRRYHIQEGEGTNLQLSSRSPGRQRQDSRCTIVRHNSNVGQRQMLGPCCCRNAEDPSTQAGGSGASYQETRGVEQPHCWSRAEQQPEERYWYNDLPSQRPCGQNPPQPMPRRNVNSDPTPLFPHADACSWHPVGRTSYQPSASPEVPVQYIFSKAKIPEFRGEVTAAKSFLKNQEVEGWIRAIENLVKPPTSKMFIQAARTSCKGRAERIINSALFDHLRSWQVF